MKFLAKHTYIAIFLLAFIFILIFDFFLKIESNSIGGGIAGGLVAFLAPRKKKIITQTGEKTQITWVFLRKPIFTD